MVSGHGGAGADRLRAELEELTGKPVLLAIGDGEPGTRRAAAQLTVAGDRTTIVTVTEQEGTP